MKALFDSLTVGYYALELDVIGQSHSATCYTVTQKNYLNQMLTDVKSLALLDAAINLQQDPCYISHQTLSMSLHYVVRQARSTCSNILMVYVGVSKVSIRN